ncbi:MAG TPA: beta-ketoacyl-ACP synthase III [bacterium]|nr:beta-ketoacyl-ACP synthase III [bacterium]HOL47186.1 beta-ketoacyl-ACP synthase III [bacterium]HPQ17678.1 beta-ketoacyl-ACP synthase III [bacterium]
MYRVKISGIGSYVPEKVMTNFDWEKLIDTTDEWIITRTGIKERHIAAKEEAASDLATRAAEKAIKNSGIKKEDIDLIIVATSTPDMIFPSTACIVQNKLGLTETPGFDILAACSGFIYAFNTAVSFITSKIYKNILIIGVDLLTRIMDWNDRNTCVLFGDAASAIVLSETPENEDSCVFSIYMGADGSLKDLLKIEHSGSLYPGLNDDRANYKSYIYMEGKEVFKSALIYMPLSVEKVLKAANMNSSDIDLLICHQANKRIIDSVGKRLNLPEEKIYVNLERFGNTSAATIPLALDTALSENRYKRNNILALTAIGGGVTYGAVLLRF